MRSALPMLMSYLCIKLCLLGMISCLSLALFVIFDDTLTRKILIFYEFYACISIINAVL